MFKDFERTYKDFERTSKAFERTFKVFEYRIFCCLKSFLCIEKNFFMAVLSFTVNLYAYNHFFMQKFCGVRKYNYFCILYHL